MKVGTAPPFPRSLQYLDLQAVIGISKHLGGLKATKELLALCHVDRAREVLDVGCGTGAGPLYISRKFGCNVVGVDHSLRMSRWARQRARRARPGDRVRVCTGDVLALPFRDNHFDAVVCESVLAFVKDKAAAISEILRVTRPGGYVGFNEALWLDHPPPDVVEGVREALAASVPTEEDWRSLWTGTTLQDRVVVVRRVGALDETKSEIRWIGWPWLLRAWGRAIYLYLTVAEVRRSLARQFKLPAAMFKYLGYGLLAGRKPDEQLSRS